MSRAIEAVLLDVGGVLLLPHHEVLVEHALGHLDLVPDAASLDRAHYVGGRALRVWPQDEEALFAQWNRAYLEHIGADVNDENLSALRSAFERFDMWTRPAPGVHEGLAAIKATGVRMAIVSNADGQVEQVLGETGLCQLGEGTGVAVDAILDSAVVGYSKPDPRIFHLALERIGVDASAAVHVGDIIGADVEGAKAAGVRPLHFDPYGICDGDDHDDVSSLVDVADLVVAARA